MLKKSCFIKRGQLKKKLVLFSAFVLMSLVLLAGQAQASFFSDLKNNLIDGGQAVSSVFGAKEAKADSASQSSLVAQAGSDVKINAAEVGSSVVSLGANFSTTMFESMKFLGQNIVGASEAFINGVKSFGQSVKVIGETGGEKIDSVVGAATKGVEQVGGKAANLLYPKKQVVQPVAQPVNKKITQPVAPTSAAVSQPAASVQSAVKELPASKPVAKPPVVSKPAAPKSPLTIYSNTSNQDAAVKLAKPMETVKAVAAKNPIFESVKTSGNIFVGDDVVIDAFTGIATLKGIKIIGTVDFSNAEVKGFKQTVVNNYSSGPPLVVYNSTTKENETWQTLSGNVGGVSTHWSVGKDLTVSQNAIVGSGLTIGTTSSNGSLTVNGTTSVTGAATFSGALTLSSSATMSGDLTVNGNTTLGDVSGDTITINGRLSTINISDSSTTSSLAKNSFYIAADSSNALGKFYVDSSGNVSASGTLQTTGSILTYGNVTSTGIIYGLGGLISSASSTFSSSLAANSLSVTGNVRASSTLLVGTAAGTDNLFVNGANTYIATSTAYGTAYSLIIGNGTTGALVAGGHAVPSHSSLFNLGSDSLRWSNIYSNTDNVSTTLYVGTGGTTLSTLTANNLAFAGSLGVVSSTAGNLRLAADGANQIRFWTNGSQRAFIDSSGNTFASGTLQTTGSILTYGNVTSTGHIYPASGNTADLGALNTAFRNIYASSSLNVGNSANSSTFMGNYLAVTDGTSSTVLNGSSLTLGSGTNYNSGMFSVSSNGNVSASGTLAIRNTTVNPTVMLAANPGNWIFGMDTSDGGKFKISSSTALGTSDRLVIDTNGNIGIGTAAPASKLEVSFSKTVSLAPLSSYGGLIVTDASFQTLGVGGALVFQGAWTGTSLTTAGAIQAYKSNNTAGDYGFDMTFHTRINGGNNTEKMRLTSAGGMALGVTTNYNQGYFFVNTNDGNVSASGSLKTFGNVTSTGNLYALTGTASTSILNGSSLTLGQGTNYGSGMFNVDSNGNMSASGSLQSTGGLLTLTGGTAITAGNYQMGRNADATNQLHFNVPTGAGFKFSVNDAARFTVSTAGNLSAVGNIAVASAGSSLTLGSNSIFGATNQGLIMLSGYSLALSGNPTDGATAKAALIGSSGSLSNTSAKLVSVMNASSERAFIGWDGSFAAAVSTTIGYAGGQFYVDSSGSISTSGTIAFTNTSAGVVSSTGGILRFQATAPPVANTPEFEFWNGGMAASKFLTIGHYQAPGTASTTFTSILPFSAAGTAGFVFNTTAAGGTMTSSTVLDRALLVVQNNGFNKFVVSPGGNVYAKNSFIANSTQYGIADVAEYINLTAGETGEPGDVLVVDLANSNRYKKSSAAYTKEIAGVISDTGAFLMGASGDGRAPLALAGLVKTKVTDENGPISIGDYLVSASKPGYAMKYDAANPPAGGAGLVGMALEPLAEGEGKIAIMVNKGLVAGSGSTASLTVNENGDGTLSGGENWDFGGKSILNVKAISSVNGLWYINESGSLVAKEIKADKVQAKKFVVEKETDLKKASVGEATISQNNSSVVVENELITSKVKIFITFRSNPQSFWWISSQVNGKFEVSLSKTAEGDLTFDYWIVGIEEASMSELEAAPTQAAAVVPIEPSVTPSVAPATEPAPAEITSVSNEVLNP